MSVSYEGATLSEFRIALKALDSYFQENILKTHPQLLPVTVRSIGGFALLYHEIRYSGVTTDIDSLVEYDDIIKEAIRRIGESLGLTWDWLNDFVHTRLGVTGKDITWTRADFGCEHIQVYIADLHSLFIQKSQMSEKTALGERTIDFEDLTAIMWKLGLEFETIDEVEMIYLRSGLSLIDDFPNLRVMFSKMIEKNR